MPISRTRSTQHKVHIPSSARENQYLMVKFPLTDHLLEKYSDLIDEKSKEPYSKFYQALADSFFKINEELDIDSSQFIANDKFVRVRFSPQKLAAQTDQQILFLYNPEYHTSQNSFFSGDIRAKKITLIFLANGSDIRVNSAKFHRKVKEAITKFSDQIAINKESVRICDHQHLTYDLFAKQKGTEGSQVHKFRSITNRYRADEQDIPSNTDALTYAVVDLPLNRRIRSLVTTEPGNYSDLYTLIADAFINCAKSQNLYKGAVIANSLVPIVRSGEDENVIASGELLMLGSNPAHTSCGYTCKWESNKLVDSVQLIFVACDKDKTSNGYGKFFNQIELALRNFAQQLDFVNDKEELTVRLHQHIGFYLD